MKWRARAQNDARENDAPKLSRRRLAFSSRAVVAALVCVVVVAVCAFMAYRRRRSAWPSDADVLTYDTSIKMVPDATTGAGDDDGAEQKTSKYTFLKGEDNIVYEQVRERASYSVRVSFFFFGGFVALTFASLRCQPRSRTLNWRPTATSSRIEYAPVHTTDSAHESAPEISFCRSER